MDPIETLNQIEAQYRRILGLVRRQETCVKIGSFTSLPSLLSEKAEILAEARGLTARAQEAEIERASPAFQAGLARVASVLAEVVAAEDRCREFVPPDPPTPPRRQALAAYSISAKR